MFSATASVGMVTINTFNVVYQFQMTASVYIGTVENEGQLSVVTSRSTVFVPQPGRDRVAPTGKGVCVCGGGGGGGHHYTICM